ncbi:hypothetical protein V1506DRAFT_462341 [Lipomyces tetrasporus]
MRVSLNSTMRRGVVPALVMLALVSIFVSRHQLASTALLLMEADLGFSGGRGGTIVRESDTISSSSVPISSQTSTVHFLLPATELNDLVCKTFFSAILNGYPSPVLLNFNAVFKDAPEARFMKIAAIYKYISLRAREDDLVIIMDAYDTWFQLPFETVLSRYYKLQERDRLAHLAAYNVTDDDALPDVDDGDIPPYTEHVVFGADKICWPNSETSPACKDVPESTLPDDIYGDDTDQDRYSYMSRPRWLNSGNIIGPASVLKEIYMRAFNIQRRAKAHFSDQLILADIFGKQDLPIRIDYESYLFQTMTHSHSDIVFLYEDQVDEGDDPNAEVIDPITGVSSANGGARKNANPGEFVDDFENKPLVDAAFYTNTTRRKSDKYLAWNRVSGNVPAVLHFNGPKLPLETWWGKMWWIHDRSPVHRRERLKYVRRNGGAFVDDRGDKFMPYQEMCGKFNMFEYKLSPYDRGRVKKGSAVGIEPEPFVLGMHPRKSPSDLLRVLSAMNKANEEKAAKAKAAKEKAAAKAKEAQERQRKPAQQKSRPHA